MQIIEIYVASQAASSERKVVLEPIDASDSLNVASEHHDWWAVASVEIVDMDVLLIGDAGKHVAAVSELDFSASLDRVRFE